MDANNYERVVYEGYGPNGTAIIVEALTDNKNRTSFQCKECLYKGKRQYRDTGMRILYV